MLTLPKQYYVIILLVGVLLVGGAVTLWRQHQQLPVMEALEPIGEEREEQLEPREVVVHVAGAVKRSGVYRLPEGSRVIDAVEAAGGGTEDADIHALNLADILVDGQRYYVPTREETAGGRGSYAGTTAGKINLNRATRAELETLPGIGPALAERIITYREEHGPFRRPEEIKNVSGIGEKTYENIKDYIYAP
ncbi:MAG TPA: hypothetical protein GX518_05280 [Firmicutes bacterium]|nr:hypothetical protein [Bacillota bacterium]